MFSREWPAACRVAALSASIFIFVWRLWPGPAPYAPSYAFLTLIFVFTIGAIVSSWTWSATRPVMGSTRRNTVPMVAAALSAALLIYFVQRWVDLMLWNAYRADMLIIIREATRRFLDGQNPYSPYHNTWDAPWTFVLSYGPLLWGPFIPAQRLQMDMRVVTIIGELFVPIWCSIAMTVEAARGRLLSAAAWGLLFVMVLVSLDVPDYTLMGHTPVYWPLLPLFAAFVTRRHWLVAALALGLLIVARSTMVALVPILLIAVWHDDRRSVLPAAAIIAGTALLILLPFIVWDAHAIWDGMVTTYPRVIKQVVWPSTEGGARDTLGLTGWLLDRHLGRFVEASQLVAMAIVAGLAWLAILRGARPLPWMGLALLAFSMTSLWPVYYVYYDVLLLFVSAAIAETLDTRLRVTSWLLSLGAAVVVVVAALNINTTSHLDVAAGAPIATRAFQQGGSVIVLPRRSASAADVIIECQPSRPPESQVTAVTAVLNGRALWTTRLLDGPQKISFAAPTSAWRIGYNRLELRSLPNDDSQPTLVINRVAVVPRTVAR